MLNILKALAILMTLAIAGSMLFRIFETVVFGAYMDTAPFPLVIFVVIVLPILICLGALALVTNIWKAK